MLTVSELKDYRLIKGLSLRDVARYCNVSPQAIGLMENCVIGLTDSIYHEVVSGINKASQAIANGTFESDKEKEREEQKTARMKSEVADSSHAIEEIKQESKTIVRKKTTARKSTKPTTSKAENRQRGL